jgi:hypothetical protein
MKKNIDYRGILKWIGTVFLTWVSERFLDNSGLFVKMLSVFNNRPNKFISFFSNTISFSYLELIIIILLFMASYMLTSLLFKKLKSNSQDEKEEKFRKRYTYMSIPENDTVIFKTEIEFGEETNEVFLNSISIRCNKHDIKYKLVLQPNNAMYECPKFPCQTTFLRQFIATKVKPILQAELEHEWNKT